MLTGATWASAFPSGGLGTSRFQRFTNQHASLFRAERFQSGARPLMANLQSDANIDHYSRPEPGSDARATSGDVPLRTTRRGKPLTPADFQPNPAILAVEERRRIAQSMHDPLMAVLIAGANAHQKHQKLEAAYNQAFNAGLRQYVFPQGPECRVSVSLNFQQSKPYLKGTFFQPRLEVRPKKETLRYIHPESGQVQSLAPSWFLGRSDKPCLYLGHSRLESSLPPTTPEGQKMVSELVTRQIHEILLLLSTQSLKQNPKPNGLFFRRSDQQLV